MNPVAARRALAGLLIGLGALITGRAVIVVLTAHAIRPVAGPVEVTGDVVLADVGHRSGAVAVHPQTVRAQGAEFDVGGDILVEVRSGQTAPSRGDRVSVAAARLLPPPLRPGALSEAALERDGIVAVASSATVTVDHAGGVDPGALLDAARQRLVGAIDGQVPEPAATLLLGIAFGISGRLDRETHTALQDTGLVHIVVISGLKVAMVIGMVSALARRREWSRRRTLLVVAAVGLLYIALSGGGPAAVRSGLMAGAGLVLNRGGRRILRWRLLAATAALMLAFNPRLLGDVGFQLSFVGTAGIMLLAEPIGRRLPAPGWLAEPFAVTVAAQLATIPVMAAVFGTVSLAGPVANAMVLPLLPPLIVLTAAGALLALGTPLLGALPLLVARVAADLIVLVARALAAIPGAAWHPQSWPQTWTALEIAAGVAAIVAWRRWRRRPAGRWRAAGAAVSIAVLGGSVTATALVGSGFRAEVIDAGKGVAVLIRDRGTTLLVDGGADGTRLLDALGAALDPLQHQIDGLVITGTDRGLLTGISDLPGRYQVGTVMILVPGLPPAAQQAIARLRAAGAQVITAGSGPIRWGGLALRCLDDGASGGCALQVGDGHSTLLVVDAAITDQQQLAASYGAGLRSQLLVSAGTVDPSVLVTARPGSLVEPGAAAGVPAGVEALSLQREGSIDFAESGGELLPQR